MRPGDVVLDAGANIGFVSLTYLSLGAAEVHAIEPIGELHTRLACLEHERLRAHHLALSDRDGEAQIFRSRRHNQGHTLNPALLDLFPKVFGRAPEVETVRLARADDLFPEMRFDFIKIDIEGSEAAFIDGAHKLLSERPPRIMQIEIYPSQFEAVDSRLRRYLPFAWRIGRTGGQIAFLDTDTPPVKGPPVFVYAATADIRSLACA